MKQHHLLSTLAFAALLAAGSAGATDVQIYGRIDDGLYFLNSSVSGYGSGHSHDFTMESGIAGASLWGIKGKEALGAGYSLAFVLESKILSDSGEMGTEDKIFDRDSYLELSTPYGNVRIGRTGMLASGVNGGIFAGQTNPFGVVYKIAGALNVFQGAAQRVGNQIRYESPNMAGVRAYLQYSNATGLGNDTEDDSLASSHRDRYLAGGLQYRGKDLRVALVVDNYFYNDVDNADYDDPRSVSLAANYRFGDFKIFGGYQYAKNLRTNIFGKNAQRGDANIVMAGGSWDVGGGTAMISAAYGNVDDAKTASFSKELDAWQVGLGYKYPFSKRTMVYGAAAYRYADLTDLRYSTKTGKLSSDRSNKEKSVALMAGLQHKF